MSREQQERYSSGSDLTLSLADVQFLNSFGYDQAAQIVYGTSYETWKERHHQKVTNEQLERYRASAPLHAVHDEALLRVATDAATTTTMASPAARQSQASAATAPAGTSSILSDVCCEDVEQVAAATTSPAASPGDKDGPGLTRARSLLPSSHPFATPPPLPAALLNRTSPLRIGVLAASDRASRGLYPDGDLSTPAVIRQVQLALQEFACPPPTVVTALVPDETDQITKYLLAWSGGGGGTAGEGSNGEMDAQTEAVDVILTTGA
jgi:hypothetical protein